LADLQAIFIAVTKHVLQVLCAHIHRWTARLS